MNSILDAVMAAQKRNTQEDRLRELRQQDTSPVLPFRAIPIVPVTGQAMADGGGGGGDGPTQQGPQETTAESYGRAVALNKAGIVNAPVIGIPIGLLNNLTIQDYETKNPELAINDPARFARPFGALGAALDAVFGGNRGMRDNIGGFPTTYNFNQGGGNDPNSDIGGSIDTTDQSPSVGVGDDDGTAVA